MQTNEASSSMVSDERVSWSEICARFPDEWVVFVDADWVDDHNRDFGTAKIFAHCQKRRDATREMGAACRAFANVAVFFTGRIRGPIPRWIP
jgi:hypothetical protein